MEKIKKNEDHKEISKKDLSLEIENLKKLIKIQNEKLKLFFEERKEMKKNLKNFSKRIENLKNENSLLKSKLGMENENKNSSNLENKNLRLISEKKINSEKKKRINLKKRCSLKEKINLNLKFSNLSYKDYIEKFAKEKNKIKIKKLMEIFYVKEIQKKSNLSLKSLS